MYCICAIQRVDDDALHSQAAEFLQQRVIVLIRGILSVSVHRMAHDPFDQGTPSDTKAILTGSSVSLQKNMEPGY